MVHGLGSKEAENLLGGAGLPIRSNGYANPGSPIKRLCQEKKDLRKQERAIFFLQGIDVLEHTPVPTSLPMLKFQRLMCQR